MHARARAADKRAGFTLLEMLVVVVIIGLVAAGAILSLGATGRDRQLEQERDRLTALIAYVRDRGAMMTTEYGIRCGQHGYRFVYYDNRTLSWQPETLDDTLRERKLPPGLDLQLVIEGRPVVLDDHALQFNAAAASAAAQIGGMAPAAASTGNGTGGITDTGDATGSAAGVGAGLGAPPLDAPAVDDNTPQILLLSNGDANSFALTIERPSAHHSVTLKSAADGTISAGDVEQATS